MLREDTVRIISEKKIIAIVRVLYDEELILLAQALHDGGVDVLEATFDPVDARERARTASSIRALVGALGGRMLFGAGTVTSVEMVRQAHEAGARFIVSPNTDEAVIRATRELDMASIPGALTPTEILCARNAGADFVKVFPACSMGVSYFRNIRAPLKDVRLLAVGGVTPETAGEYLSAGCAGLGVAGCLFRKEWVRDGELARVTQAARKLLAALPT